MNVEITYNKFVLRKVVEEMILHDIELEDVITVIERSIQIKEEQPFKDMLELFPMHICEILSLVTNDLPVSFFVVDINFPGDTISWSFSKYGKGVFTLQTDRICPYITMSQLSLILQHDDEERKKFYGILRDIAKSLKKHSGRVIAKLKGSAV